MTKSNTSATLGILIGLLILTVCLAGYQWYKLNQLKAQVESLNSNKLENERIQAELEQDYQAALQNLEEMRGTNTELNTLIDEQKLELSAQKKKISNLIWTQGELEKARQELEVFRVQAAGYANQVKELQEKNQVLTSQNTNLSIAKQELESTVNTQVSKIQELDERTEMLSQNIVKMEEVNTNLSGKVDIAEAIKINSIIVEGYKEKEGRDDSSKSRAKSIDYLKTCIITESNYVVEPGSETFYVRFVSPGGQTLQSQMSGNGTVTNKMDGSDVKYTFAGSATYQRDGIEKCFDWKPEELLPAGNYGVEVFNKGYLVGKGSFLLK